MANEKVTVLSFPATMGIIEKLKYMEGCVLTELPPSRIEAYRSLIPDGVPGDLDSVLRDYYEVEIFSAKGKISPGYNTWAVGSDFFSNAPTIASYFGPPDPCDFYMAEYYELFYRLGYNQKSSSEIIGISLHPSSRGMVFFYYIASTGAPVGMGKIANSFTEWVDRTIAAGPDGEPYWCNSDFIDLGPAVPNDPYYEPIGRVD